MKILIDTNILISALVFGGKALNLLAILTRFGHELCASSFIENEFQAKIWQKWPQKAEDIYDLYLQIGFKKLKSTKKILDRLRDKKDLPVLSDGLFHKMDVILTGDKDFLEANLNSPLILSPSLMLVFLGIN